MVRVVFVRVAPFVNKSIFHPRDIIIPFNIGFAMTLLEKHNYSCALLDTWLNNETPDEIWRFIKSHKPEYLVIENTTSTIEIVKEIFSSAKKTIKSFNIAMGQNASALPESLLDKSSSVDVCVYGEAEKTIERIVLSKGSKLKDIENIYFLEKGKIRSTKKEGIVEDLTKLPRLNYDHFYKENKGYQVVSTHIPVFKKIKWGFILSSRGCPYNCIYCSPTLRHSYGKRFRAHKAEWVYEEMKRLKEVYGVNAIFFPDDLFTFDRDRVIDLCKLIINNRLKIKWAVQTRVDYTDPEMLKYLKKAGCSTLCMGIESGNNRILRTLNKSITKEKIIEKLMVIKKFGFILDLYFMIGNPTETEGEATETFKLAIRFKPEILRFAFFTPYPGSPIYERIAKEQEIDLGVHHYDSLKYNFSNISTERLLKLQKDFYKRYYLSIGYIFKYFIKRMPYELLNIDTETRLVKSALQFIFRKNEN